MVGARQTLSITLITAIVITKCILNKPRNQYCFTCVGKDIVKFVAAAVGPAAALLILLSTFTLPSLNSGILVRGVSQVEKDAQAVQLLCN